MNEISIFTIQPDRGRELTQQGFTFYSHDGGTACSNYCLAASAKPRKFTNNDTHIVHYPRYRLHADFFGDSMGYHKHGCMTETSLGVNGPNRFGLMFS